METATLVLKLSERGRTVLKVPCGYAVRKPPREAIELLLAIKEYVRAPMLITVGDIVSYNVSAQACTPDVAIVDERTQRAPAQMPPDFTSQFDIALSCDNPPGTLTPVSWGTVYLAVLMALSGKKVLVLVRGEEDLLAIPAALAAPPRSLLIYGLRDEALVVLPITEYLRKPLKEFVAKYFEIVAPVGKG